MQSHANNRRITLASVAVLIAGCTSLGVAHAEQLRGGSRFAQATSALPDSASMSGAVLTSGALVSSAGHPLAGATVVLAVEPSNERLAHMHVGDEYKVRYVSRATTSADGQWTLRLPSLLDLSDNVSRAGDVNFELMSSGTGWSAVSHITSAGAHVVTGTAKARGVVVSDGAGRS